MDKLLAQLMNYVDEIAGLVSEAAPVVWEMLVKQVQVEIFGHVLWAIAGLVLFGISFKIPRDEDTTYEWSRGNVFGFACVLLGGLALFFTQVYCAGARLINPAWYAVKLLLETAGGN